MSNSAIETDTRRWNAFVCADCRAIFRVPVGHSGLGIVCPACERMLRLPKAGDAIPELVSKPQPVIDDKVTEPLASHAEQAEAQPESMEMENHLDEAVASSNDASAPSSQGVRRRKKRRESNDTDAETEWQQGSNHKMLRFTKSRPPWWMIAAIAVLSLLLVMVVAMLLNNTRPTPTIPPLLVAPEPLSIAPVNPLNKEDFNLTEIETIVKSFVNSQTVDELLLHVRDRQGIEQKIRDYYLRNSYASVGFANSVDISVVAAEKGVVTISFQTKNFEPRQIFLCKNGAGYLVDWESWVGWSEMSFAELKKNKPTHPIEVRVTMAAESYYNFDFPPSEEFHWQSYRLFSADGESILHGYVEKATDLDNQLRLSSDTTSKQMILLIKYPDNAMANDQVIIEKIVADGWVK